LESDRRSVHTTEADVMRSADRIALDSSEEKADREKELERRKNYRSGLMKKWWASLTPEQHAEQVLKIRVNRQNRVKREKPGHIRGERHYRAKLTEVQVREINISQEPPAEIAVRYGVTVKVIRAIWTGKTWQHLQLPRVEHLDRRTKPESDKKPKIKAEPRISKEMRKQVLACPLEDTRQLAERLGMHWFDVATIRLKDNGSYKRLKDDRK